MIDLDLEPLVHLILEDYCLRWHGTHGVGHWALDQPQSKLRAGSSLRL
jgi:hypothetical protein